MQVLELDRAKPKITEGFFLLNELFYSLQGEGASIGQPAVFARLHLCNLACTWCDTKYTWDPRDPGFDQYEQLSPPQLLERISAFPCRRLVITGGEPLLYTRQIETLLQLLSPEWQVEIETNGTMQASALIRERCQLNISPKLPSASNRARSVRPNVLKLLSKSPNAWFKFVVSDETDFEAMEKVIEECRLDRSRVIVMPEGQTVESLRDHSLAVAERVKASGYRLLPRLHVLLYGSKRGI